MSDDKWSNDTIVLFLEVYERHNILWDRRLEDYANREIREQELKKVIEELKKKSIHLDSATLRMKIRIFKTVYNQELNKVLLSQRNADSKGIYKPRLFWFDKADRFLRSVAYKKSPNVHLKSSVKRKGAIAEDEDGVEQITKRKSSRKTSKFLTSNEDDAVVVNSTDDVDDYNYVHKADHATPFLSARELELDELDHFGKYIVASLKKLPSINALRCQQEIHAIITNERIQLLTQHNDDCEIVIHDEDT